MFYAFVLRKNRNNYGDIKPIVFISFFIHEAILEIDNLVVAHNAKSKVQLTNSLFNVYASNTLFSLLNEEPIVISLRVF